MLWLRAFAVWLAIAAAETIHGVLRTMYVAPIVGDFTARQIAVFTGSAIILAIAWLAAPWLRATQTRRLIAVGSFWVALMLAFELALGRLVFGYAWSRLAEDFDIANGGLLGLGLIVLAFAPLIGERLHARRRG